MKLSEIVLVAPQSETVLKSYIPLISNEKELGKSESFNVFKGQIDGMIAYVARTLDGEFMGYAIGQNVKIVNKLFFQPKYTYFLSKFRSKGFATALYLFIVKKLDIPIVSDGEQTKYGRQMWVALAKGSGKCSVYDSETDSIVALNSVDQDKLYSIDPKIGDRYHLVLEQFTGIKRSVGPSKVFHENINYTRPGTIYL